LASHCPAELRRKVEIAKELELRLQGDPLLQAYANLTDAATYGGTQKSYVLLNCREKMLEGGNRAGKTWTAAIDFLLRATGQHPTYKWPPEPHPPKWKEGNWIGWWGAVTLQLWAQQAWKHFRRLLFYPGESVHRLPSRRVLAIAWDRKNPEVPTWILVKRQDAYSVARGLNSEIYVKSYDQNTDAWQSAEVDDGRLDEECDEDKYDELGMRIVDRAGLIGISATPRHNVPWLSRLRARARGLDPDVKHVRLSMRDNPAVPQAEIAKIERKWARWPAQAALRLDGFPMAEEGMIYPDRLWIVANDAGGNSRLVDPFSIPADWTRYRCIDHGVHTVACLWAAVAPGRKKVVLYREYYGQDVEPPVQGNAAEILRLSAEDGGEAGYYASTIDPATLGSGQETGTRLIDLWNDAGFCKACGSEDLSGERCKCGGVRLTIAVTPAPDNRVESGIEAVKELLLERAPDGSPLLVVFNTLHNLEYERMKYSRQPMKEKGDEGRLKPVKREDHLMDTLRYLAAAGLDYHEPKRTNIPPEGTLGHEFWKRRHKEEDED
jgi:hypothetical protein